MKDCCKPIGIFDSGVGGISVLKTAFQLMPNENFIYFGDNKNAPYGNKTEQEIKDLSLAAGRFLYNKDVKAIVMACNTATSAAVIMMRNEYNIPVISMEPAVKPAIEQTDGNVIVLATPATVTQARYHGLLERLGANGRVINIGCSGLVELIEDGQVDTQSIHAYLDKTLSGVMGEPISAVVIGCTHYSFVQNEIKSYMDNNFNTDCRIYDGRHGTARHLLHILESHQMRCSGDDAGRIEYHTSGHPSIIEIFKRNFENFNV